MDSWHLTLFRATEKALCVTQLSDTNPIMVLFFHSDSLFTEPVRMVRKLSKCQKHAIQRVGENVRQHTADIFLEDIRACTDLK